MLRDTYKLGLQRNVRRCPECGAFFLYTYEYEYGAMGDGWENAKLERIEQERVVALLIGSVRAPTAPRCSRTPDFTFVIRIWAIEG